VVGGLGSRVGGNFEEKARLVLIEVFVLKSYRFRVALVDPSGSSREEEKDPKPAAARRGEEKAPKFTSTGHGYDCCFVGAGGSGKGTGRRD